MNRTAGKRRRNKGSEEEGVIAPYPQEALLIGVLPEITGTRVLCTSAGLAQFAGAVAEAKPEASVVCSYLDLYRANLATSYWGEKRPNLRIECTAELADGEVDIVAFPFSAGGEAELTREFLQTGHERLQLGGQMFASTENRKDKWLGEVMSSLFRKFERRATSKGVLYVGTKTQPLKKLKTYACEFAFRDRGRLIKAYSRPGVFSHRSIDAGARQLIEEMQIEPGSRVLDIGCGSGIASLAAAFRAEGVTVHAADSNVRAVECTQRGAELNALTTIATELNAAGNYTGSGTYDVALANPPYFAGFKIAEHFATAGDGALRPGGQIFVVTKMPDWYHENMRRWFRSVSVTERKGYFVIRGMKP